MENIKIASYDFDVEKLLNKITELRTTINAQNRELNTFKSSLNAVQKELVSLEKSNTSILVSMSKLRDEGKQNTDAYKSLSVAMAENEKRTAELKDKEEFLVGTLVDLEPKLASLRNEHKLLSSTLKAVTDNTGEFLTATETANDAINKEITSIASARASNTEILAIRNQLNPAIKEEADLILRLNEKLDENNKFIKENSSAYEQQKINIGNYTESIKEAFDELNLFNGGLMGFIARSQEAGGVGKLVTGSFSQMRVSIIGATKSALAFIATPIGAVLTAIVGVIALVNTALQRNEQSFKKLEKAVAPVTAWLGKFMDVLAEVGGYIIDGLVVYLGVLEKQLYASLDGLIYIAEKLGFERVANSLKDFKEEMVETANVSREVKELQEQIADAEIKKIKNAPAYTKALKEQEIIAKNTANSVEDRRKAINKILELTKQNIKDENDILQLKLKQLNAQNALSKIPLSKEQQKELAELQAQIDENNNRMVDAERDTVQTLNGIYRAEKQKRREQEAENKRQIEERYNLQKKRLQEELELWIQQQGVKAKTLEEQLEQERKIAQDKIKILDFELKNKKISQTKYNAERLALENELFEKELQIIEQVAQDELDVWLRNNKSILENDVLLNEELLNNEMIRLETEREQRLNALAQRNIDEREANKERLAIEDKFLLQKKELEDTYYQQQKAQEDIQNALDFEARILRMQEERAYQFEIEQEVLDNEMQGRLNALNTELENELISEANYQQALANIQQEWNMKSQEIERLKWENKQDLMAQSFGMASDIIGRETALGKISAIAQAMIDARLAFSKALADLPPPFGQIMAGISLAKGLANVREIMKVNANVKGKFYDGGYTGNGGKYDYAGEVHKGEFVFTREQTQRLGLSRLTSLANTGVMGQENSFVQTQLNNNFNVSLIAEAVKQGAFQGSRQGSEIGANSGMRDLANDRNVMLNANH